MPKLSRPLKVGPLTKGFAARLRAAREAKGLSKHTLADKSGLTRQRVIHLEQGSEHPRLAELEQLAKALGVGIAKLVGIPDGAGSSAPASPFPREVLEGLVSHFRQAADAIAKFLDGEVTPAAAPRSRRPALKEEKILAAPKAKPVEDTRRWPWKKILPVAMRLLDEKPTKSWKPIELVQAIRAAGLQLASYRGLHFAIVPQLRQAELIVESKDGTFKYKVIPAKKLAAPKAEKPAKTAAKKAAPPKHESSSASIDALLEAAKKILDAEPAKAWKPIDFVHALREAGVTRPSWRGAHLSLPKTLTDAGLIQTNGTGRFVAAGQQAKSSDEPEQRKGGEAPPAARPDDHGSSVTSLAQEVEALSPRLTGMTPRERVAQLAVWAGRARQLDWALAAKRIPPNSGLRNTVKQVIAKLKKLRKSLGCGWVDALSPAWTTDWDIYVKHNRAVASSEPSSLSNDEKKTYFQDLLRSILKVRQGYARDLDAPAIVIEAAQVLDADDRLLIEAKRRLGDHQDRREGNASPAAPFRRQDDAPQRIAHENKDAQQTGIPRSVLKITRGRTLLIAGGRGSHDTQRLAVKKGLQFKLVDWITGDRHPNPADLFSLAIRNKKYDIVLLMPGTEDTEPLVLACKEAGALLMYLTRGPSIPSVAEAITGQQGVGGQAPEWMGAK